MILFHDVKNPNHTSKNIESMKKEAERNGLTVIQKSNIHWQIKGIILVNYYPDSKEKTAYIQSTKKGIKNVTPEMACKLAMEAPPIVKEQVKRKQSYKKYKVRLLEKSTKCKWCGIELTLETATIEHIVPLKRGGLDNFMNWALACMPCNKKRGHDMPELNGDFKND